MDITINERLKEFRRDKKNTQEDLAAHLGISIQAVSKWERNEGYPDITLLPAISSFYNVTVDDLLGVDSIKKQAKIDDYQNKEKVLFNQGKTAERVVLWREAYKEFPNDLNVIYQLMYALQSEDSKKNGIEIISYGKRILNEATETTLREGAIQSLCFTCHYLGNIEETKKYAAMAGSYHTTVNQLMNILLEGDEAIAYCQRNIESLIDLAAGNVSIMLWKGKFSDDECIKASEFVLKLYALLYDDGNYGFYHCRVSEWSMRLAKLYAKAQCQDETLVCLKNAAKNAIAYDTSKGGKYTALLMNRCEHKPECIAKDYTENDSMLRLKGTADNCFDFVRETDRFKEIVSQLRETAL